MDCKKCGKELEGELELCPTCAEEAAKPEEIVTETVEETVKETKKEEKAQKSAPEYVSPWKIMAATAVCMVLLMVLGVTVLNSITGSNWPFDLIPEQTTAAPAPTTVPQKVYTAEELGMVEGIGTKTIYGVDETALVDRDVVVASVGHIELTNAQLQVLYWNQFYRFVNNYDYSSTGFDPTAPHGEQPFPQSDVTWEQYFLSGALQTWHQYAALIMAAEEVGYELPEDVKLDLANLPTEYDKQAVENGYADGAQLLRAQMGPGVTMDDLVAVETMFAIGDNYYTEYRESLEFTRDEVEAHFDKYSDVFANNYGVDKEIGKLVSVRHVLLQPEGCEFDDYNYVVATDEQWEACRAEAQALLDAWVKSGASEENFALMAGQHSVDGGSASTGGLYENVVSGQMVEAFDAWIFDETREPGSYGLVKTEFGYHLMYYVSGEEAWYLYGLSSSDGLLSMTCYEKITEYTDANPLQVSFDKINFAAADFSLAEQAAQSTESTEPTAATE